MMKFKCALCNIIVEDEGTRKEYNSSIYGPCFKYVATCPVCRNEIDEYRYTVQKKSQNYSPEGHSCNGCCCR